MEVHHVIEYPSGGGMGPHQRKRASRNVRKGDERESQCSTRGRQCGRKLVDAVDNMRDTGHEQCALIAGKLSVAQKTVVGVAITYGREYDVPSRAHKQLNNSE